MNKKPWLILGIVICIIYIISPLDLIPEIPLGPMGLIDDAGVLAFMLFLIKKLWGLRDEKHAIDVQKITWKMTMTLVRAIRPGSPTVNDTV